MNNSLAYFDGYIEQATKLFRSTDKSVKSKTESILIAMHQGKGPDDPEINNFFSEHGENRIKNCKKYRPVDDYRLVTVYLNNTWVVLFVGHKNDAEKFLDSNAGKELKCNSAGQWIFVKGRSFRNIQPNIEILTKPVTNVQITSPLIKKLPTKYETKLKKRCQPYPELLKLVVNCTNKDELDNILNKINDINFALSIMNVFEALSSNDQNALELAKLHINDEFRPVEENTQSQIKQSSQNIQIIDNIHEWLALIDKAVVSDDWKTWMTRMHPDQQRIVDEDFSEPVYLKGVSGSGKTSVIVSRAERLAKKYANEKILIVTLNRSLASLIEKLIKTKCPELKNIEVKAFFTVCQNLLKEFGEDMRRYSDISDVHEEHIDQVWDAYYRCEENNNDAAVFHEVHDSLVSGKDGVYPYTYIREELDWVRSAFRKGHREKEYLVTDRSGRKKNVNRAAILQGLNGWEEKIHSVGITDYLNFSSMLTVDKYFESIEAKYRCILVDESQDFGTTELQIIRKLTNEMENDLFICGDPAQKISHKHQVISAAGIPKTKELKSISENWRNTKQIVEFSNRILRNNARDHNSKSNNNSEKYVTPESRNRNGPEPLLVKSANDLSDEIASAMEYLKYVQKMDQGSNSKHCIAICGFNENEIYNYSTQIGLPTLDGTKTLDDGSVFLTDLENAKGFEFDTVIILNCSDMRFPRRYAAPEERLKDLSRLYVAMTRAKHELIISHSGRISDFLSGEKTMPAISLRAETILKEHNISDYDAFISLTKKIKIKNLNEHVSDDVRKYFFGESSHNELTWNDFLKSKSIKLPTAAFDTPRHIEDMLGKNTKVSEMTWDQFLNTTYVITLSRDLISSIRDISKNASLNNQKVKIFYDELNAYKINDKLKNPEELRNVLDHIKSIGLF